MAVTFTGAGVAGAASGASPQLVTTATSFAVGDYLVALMAYDNSGGGGSDPMSGTITITPVGGTVGASVSAQTGLNDPGAASAGVAVRCVVVPVTGVIPNGSSVQLSYSGTVVVRAVALMKVSSNAGGTINYRTNNANLGYVWANTTTPSLNPVLPSSSVNSDDALLCWAACENGAAITGDSDTLNGSWSTVYGTFQGTGLTGQAAYFQSKVVTAAGMQSWNITSGTATDWLLGCVVFTETIPPAITQAAYQFFDDAGTESGAAALGALNTAINPLLVGADGFGVLRVRLQSTTAVAVPATDDWQLQYEKNASGTWINEGTGAVLAYNNPNLTGGAASTNRLGAGTGSFVAGKVSETGDVPDLGWTANNYTELVYSLQLVAAQLAGGDVLRFRVLRNGVTTNMTYSVTPTINIKVPVAVAGSSGGTSTATANLSVGLALVPALPNTRALETTEQRNTEAGLPRALESLPPILSPIPTTGLRAWWDAADASTITHTGGNVSEWRDKSTFGQHQVPQYGSPPRTGVRTINGVNALDFAAGDGMRDWTTWWDQPMITVFAVIQSDTPAADTYYLGNSSSSPLFGQQSGKWVASSGPPYGGITSGSVAVDTSPHMVVTRLIPGGGDGAHIRIDGVPGPVGYGGPWTGGSSYIGVGGWDGAYGEIFFYDRVLTDAEINQVESYLTTKWFGAPFEPDSVPGLAGWWDADDVSTIEMSGLAVAKWSDKSGNKHDARQAQAQVKPTRDGLINERPALNFTPSGPYMLTQASLWAQALGQAEIFLVLKLTTENAGALLGFWGGTAIYNHYPFSDGNVYESWGSAGRHTLGNPAADLLRPHIYNLRSSPTGYIAAFNGVVLYNNPSNTVNFTSSAGGAYQFGMDYNQGNGYMGEVVMYDRVLTPEERTKVEQYLTAKWLVAPPLALVGSTSGISTATGSLAFLRPLVATAGGSSTATATSLVKTIPLAGTSGGLSTAGATPPAVARALVAVAPAGTSTATATTLVKIVSLAGSSAASSTATATGIAKIVSLAGTTGGSSTAAATTALMTRGLAGTTGGLSTTTAATAVDRALVGTSTGLSTTTGAVVRTIGLSGTSGPLTQPLAPIINDTFTGTAGTPLSSVGWITDQFSSMLQLDGVGNAVPIDSLGGATNLTPINAPDLWQEWVFSFPALTGQYPEYYFQFRMPDPLWYHGYNVYLYCGNTSGTLPSMRIFRDDANIIPSITVTIPQPLAVDTDHTVRVEMRGANIKAFLDDVLWLDWTDPTPLTGLTKIGPWTGVSIESYAVPIADTKLRSYQAGEFGASGVTAIGTLDVVRAHIALVGSSSGTSTCGGPGFLVARAFAGTSNGLSTATGGQVIARSLVATAAGGSTTTAALVKAIPLAASTADGLSTTTGSLAVAKGLVGSAAATSTATGALIVARTLTAPTVVGTSSVTGTMAVARPLVGTTTGISTTTAAMAADDALIGSAGGLSTTTGDLIVARALVATTTGTSTITGNMVAVAAGGVSALTIGSSTATGSLRVSRPLVGSSGGLSATSGSLNKTIQVAGTTGGLSTTTAAAAVARALVGSTGGVSTTTGAFIRAVAFVATSGGVTATIAALARAVPLAGGSVTGSSTSTAAVQVARSLVGSSTGLSTATAATRVALTLVGRTDGWSTADGLQIAIRKEMEASAVGVSDAVGALTVILIVPTYGMWNGQVFEEMQYNGKQVVAWMLTPP